MRLFIFIMTFIMISPIVMLSQEISNIHFEQVGKQIHIYYDLEGDQAYTVQVFCSTDNGQTWGKPLQKATGEVAENQIQGNAKMIVWDVLAEREKLSGETRFKIEALPGNIDFFIDSRDGQIYKWVKIGEQVWMAENMNYKKGNSWCYDNKATNCNKYGRLYKWKTARTACPSGWHLPTDEEWEILVNYLGRYVAAGKMKETGTTHWLSPNTGATNESSFSALPGGYRDSDGRFSYIGGYGYWWSATEHSLTSAWGRRQTCVYDVVYRYYYSTVRGFSVRCLRD